jgi:hypothetical protein
MNQCYYLIPPRRACSWHFIATLSARVAYKMVLRYRTAKLVVFNLTDIVDG